MKIVYTLTLYNKNARTRPKTHLIQCCTVYSVQGQLTCSSLFQMSMCSLLYATVAKADLHSRFYFLVYE